MDFPTILAHLHPVLVHFPIVCLLLALLFDWMALLRRAPLFGPASRPLLWIGVLVGVVTVLSGRGLDGEMRVGLEPADIPVIERHELFAYITAAAAALAVIVGEIGRRKPSRGQRAVYLLLVHVAAAAVAVAGLAGGQLVWGSDWLPW